MRILVPSYGRDGTATTMNLLPSAQAVVPEDGEACFMVDDDLLEVLKIKHGKMDDIEQTLEAFANLADEMGVYFGGFSIYSDPVKYAEYAPFSFTKPCYQCVYIRRDSELTYDEDLGRYEDADIYLQYMLKHRIVLRDNRYHFRFECNKDTTNKTQRGGIEHNESRHGLALDKLIRRWGDLIKQKDGRMNGVNQPIQGI